ncbi:MAG: cohesin domain-containing protein [candidate division KSB1 bacterium]|jgi:hypothetical protein|nr:cohesin domain-containing protein [candidate division KSB1 bacterium]
MKKYIVIFFAMLCITGISSAQQTIVRLPDQTTALYDQNVSIPVTVSTDSLIREIQFVIQYDSTIIEFADVSVHKDLESFGIDTIATQLSFDAMATGTNKNLLFRVSSRNTAYITGIDVGLINIIFDVVSRRGESAMIFDNSPTHSYVKTIDGNTIDEELIAFFSGKVAVDEQSTAVLEFQTSSSEVKSGSIINVSVSIDQVYDLHGYEISIDYDPMLLSVISVEEGSFLNQNGFVFTNWFQPSIDNINGKILNVRTVRQTSSALNGSGNLLNIAFNVIGEGEAVIDFLQESCRLLDPLGRDIMVKEFVSLKLTAFGDPKVMLSVSDANGILNQTIDVPVNISEIADFSIISALISVNTDSSVLIPVEVVAENTLTEEWYTPTYRIDGGTINFALAGFKALASDGRLIYLRYRVNENAKDGDTTTIRLASVLLNEGDPGTTVENGLFRTIGLQVSGNIAYSGTQIPVPGAEVRLEGDFIEIASSSRAGNYGFAQLRYGNYRLLPTKRDDQGQSVTPFDAALVLQHIVDLTRLTGYQMIAANVTGDSTVSALDASQILSYSVGLLDEFPVMEDPFDFWVFISQDHVLTDSNWFQLPAEIRYEPLDRNYFNQNFLSIVRGDVSQNWQPATLNKELAVQSCEMVSAALSFGDVHIGEGDHFTVPVVLRADMDVSAVQLEIAYSPEKANFIGAERSSVTGEFMLAHNVVDDVIKIAMASAAPSAINGDLVVLHFEDVSEDFDNPCLFVSALINEDQYVIMTDVQDSNSRGEQPETFSLENNYPNPFNNRTLIEYSIVRPGFVELSVFNLAGARVKTLVSHHMDAGRHHAVWRGDDLSGSSVSSGTYLLKLSNGMEQRVRKVLYLK